MNPSHDLTAVKPGKYEKPFAQSPNKPGHLGKAIHKSMETLLRETWLPMGMRSLIAEELSALQNMLGRGNRNQEAIEHITHAIAMTLHAFGDAHPDSALIAHMRIVHAELKDDSSAGSLHIHNDAKVG